MNILYKLYEFLFFFFRNYYYKDDLKECKRHSSVVFTAFISFPFIGLLIFLSLKFFNDSAWSQQSTLMRKILLLPIAALLFFIGFKFIKIKKFNSLILNKEEKGVTFKSFTLLYKLKYLIVFILLFISVFFIPILIFELLK